jgi:tRNA A-37 threonylcarbamoyl transferase component Bud32
VKDSTKIIFANNRAEGNILRGLSGCPIVINQSGTITKYSSSPDYNERLLKQAEKQVQFSSNNIENIKCPVVIDIKKENLFSFEMEYVRGSNYLDFLGCASPEYINFFGDSILRYLDVINVKNKCEYTRDEFCILCYNKIKSLDSFPQYRDFSEYLNEKIKNINYRGVGKTFCHGDLTLSNILFTHESIFFLDFLDSYIESWIIDLIKLKQDLFYLWGISREKENLDLRSVQTSLHIWEMISSKYTDITSSEEFKIAESINFLRILPYIKNKRDFLILEKIIKKTPLYEEFNNTNGR